MLRFNLRRWLAAFAAVLWVSSVSVDGQGSLSQQVLQLLSRTNSWIGENTFYDIRIYKGDIPGDTDSRLYANATGDLFYESTQLTGGGGGGTTPHNLLSTTHPDTVVGSPTRGAVVVGNSTPAWAASTPTTGFVQFNGTDTVFSTSLANGTSIPAAELTGTLPAITGSNLTALNASNLSSGTVPLARLSGITNTEISAAAAISYSKLNLASSVNLSSDTAATALPFAKGGTGLTTAADDTVPLSSGSAWVASAIPNCVSGTTALAYTAATNTFSCQSLSVGSGTVTSVTVSLPAIFSVSGSPITTSGTIAASLASQLQNLVWASPNGSSGAPTFRSLVNADLPTSGVAAGNYAKVTVNTQGIVTAGSTQITLSTDATGTLARANGGTGLTTAGDDTVMVGNGTSWVQTAVPDCTRLLSYSTTTNLITCTATAAYGTLTSSTPFSITGTWNSGGTTFNQFLVNVTDSASATASLLADFQIGGSAKLSIRKNGSVLFLGSLADSTSTPTISSGFGTSPAIEGTDYAMRITQGNPVGATGVITFGQTFANAPICIAQDETTTAGNPLKVLTTTTTATVLSGGTMVAADTLTILCRGY